MSKWWDSSDSRAFAADSHSPAACPAPDQLIVTDRYGSAFPVVKSVTIEDQTVAVAIIHTPGWTDGCMTLAALQVAKQVAENHVRDGDECIAITAARIGRGEAIDPRRHRTPDETYQTPDWPPPKVRASKSGKGNQNCADYLAGVERRFLTPNHSARPRIAAGLRKALTAIERSALRKAVILIGPLCDGHTYEGDSPDPELVANAIAKDISIEALFMQSTTPSGLLDPAPEQGAPRLQLFTKETGGRIVEVNPKTAPARASAMMKNLRRQCEVTVRVPGSRTLRPRELSVRSRQPGVARIVRVGR